MRWATNLVSHKYDYRHPKLTDELFSQGRRVLVLGTSRIGKTTLLNRLRERDLEAAYIDLRDGAKSALKELKKAKGLLLLDEGQALVTTWEPEQIASLDAALRRRGARGFVLAGWPNLTKAGAPQELKRLLEHMQDTKWLGPLTEQQAARMVRCEKSEAPLPCGEEVVKAIYRATGGFPNLIADLCDFLTADGTDLKVPGDEELEGFLAHAWSHANPFQNFYDSLDPGLQGYLERYRQGEHNALQALRRYGVVAEDGSRFKGELFERVWGSGGWWWESSSAEQSRGAPPPSSPAESAPQIGTRRSSRKLRILAVATEWLSGHGGLSTFNRELCLAMARAGHEVYCYVPAAREDERKHSRQHGVNLVVAPGPGEERERLHRKPPLPGGVVPDVIIGHGRVTGSAALSLMDYFPKSRRVHFLHMAPEQIEWFKDHADGKGAMQKTDERKRMEVDLAKSAQLVAAVGPRLQREFARLLHPHGCKVHTFIPGLGNVAQVDPPQGEDFQILLLGRAEDLTLKGLDIAARAVAQASRSLKKRLILVVRGVPADKEDGLRDYLYRIAGSRNFNLLPRPYSPDEREIQVDIQQSSLVLMPSRSEGFGLVGLEAISAGVPILLSKESGLAELIGGLSKEMADCHVVPTPEELERAAPVWSRRIDFILRDRKAAFDRVRELRALLMRENSWDSSVERLLHELPLEEGMAS